MPSATNIREVMTPYPTALPSTTSVADAARTMRDADIGDVIVLDDAQTPCGIITDRDIVLRAVAEQLDPSSISLGDICTHDLVTVDASATTDDAARIMSDKSVRRLPVVENGKTVGIVTLGDLSVDRKDAGRALEDISNAPPNN